MIRRFIQFILLFAVSIFLIVSGCTKEKIVESTEYIEHTEYIELPGDTVYQVDSIYVNDSITVYVSDTLYIYDTLETIQYIYDTVMVYDTVEVVQYYYDTTVVTDTVLTIQCAPNEDFAISAMQYYSDPLVIALVNAEFGYTGGWIFYLSSYQINLIKRSNDVYDIYGYIDYWTPNWLGYYPLEFNWRVTYLAGDPSDPNNWRMSEPVGVSIGHQPGIGFSSETAKPQNILR